MRYESVIRRASALLHAAHPRNQTAQAFLSGHQSWSLSDLRGKAKRFSGSYARARNYALEALGEAGGSTCYVGPHGRRMAIVYAGQDDFGDALFETAEGLVRMGASTTRLEWV